MLKQQYWLNTQPSEKAWENIPKNNLLAAICYANADCFAQQKTAFLAYFGTDYALPLWVNCPPVSQHSAALWQFIYSKNPSVKGQDGAISYQSNSDFIFGTLALPTEHQQKNSTSITEITESAYNQIFDFLYKINGEHNDLSTFKLWRVWNYLAHINKKEEQAQTENYRLFNTGRSRAYTSHNELHNQTQFPSACAMGTIEASGSTLLNIGFLASRFSFTQIENPRQNSAFEYPKEYSNSSPIFSRAIIGYSPALQSEQLDHPSLWISGTASIVGHQSCHPGNVQVQCKEAILNIQTLIDTANKHLRNQGTLSHKQFEWCDLNYQVYLRNPKDLALVEPVLRTHLPKQVICHYLRADICRSELLVEIEATAL